MAETRKYDPVRGSAIAEALRAAMGEPVRPDTPGEAPRHKLPAEPDAPATTWVALNVTTSEPEAPQK